MVYTDQEGMYRFFESLKLEHVTVYYRKELHLKKNIRIIRNYFKERKRILNELKSRHSDELYFFHNTFATVENRIIKKLSKTTMVYHIPIFNKLPFKKRYTIRALKGVLLSWLINGIKVVPLNTGERFIYKVDDSFFRKINANKKQLIIDNKFIKELIDKRFYLGKIEIVLLTGSIVELNRVEEQEYISKIDALIDTIGADKIVAKPHPRFPNRYGKEKELELVPPYVPANVLFTKFKIFIGYSTTVLTEAANEGLTAISLLDYLEPVSEDAKDNYKEYLINNLEHGVINFPTNTNKANYCIINSTN